MVVSTIRSLFLRGTDWLSKDRFLLYRAKDFGSPGASPGARRPALVIAAITLGLWLILEACVLRSPSLVGDWMGWRQADTQTMALNLTKDHFDVLHPRIAWGGAGPGIVESEFPLYAALVGAAIKVFGAVEWPGQFISLGAVAAAAWVWFLELNRRFGPWPAILGFGAFLTCRGVMFLGPSVQPDTLTLLFYVATLSAFLRYLDTASHRWLLASALLTTLAALTKPPALQLGLIQAVLVLALRRDRMRSLALWLSWVGILVCVGVKLWYSYSLFVKYGNTFGVIGGESKGPRLEHLFMPGLYFQTASITVYWSLGIPGLLALGYLAVRRRVDAMEVGLLLGNAAFLAMSVRYSSNVFYGPHYSVPLAALAGWAIAHAFAVFQDELTGKTTRILQGFAASSLIAQGTAHALLRTQEVVPLEAVPEYHQAQALLRASRPEERIVVRSIAPAYDVFWQTRNNFEDPRVFYLAQRQGWPLGVDDRGTASLERFWRQGARFYVEGERTGDSELEHWLLRRARVEWESSAGRLFRLLPETP